MQREVLSVNPRKMRDQRENGKVLCTAVSWPLRPEEFQALWHPEMDRGLGLTLASQHIWL